jgi:hypothetical protein
VKARERAITSLLAALLMTGLADTARICLPMSLQTCADLLLVTSGKTYATH